MAVAETPSAEFGNYYVEFKPNEGLNFSIPWPNSGAGNYDLFLSTTRKVGIGTNNFNCSDCSDYRLFVKEGIRTEKVKVDISSVNGWADFVFKEDYSLMSIENLENYIKKNGHLPGIKSAEEVVEEGGVELKEMSVKLLQKIEELTLYIIKLDKEIKRMRNEK